MTFTSTHWGNYRPVVRDGRLTGMEPAPWDTDPSPIGQSIPGSIDSPTRVRRPAVRRGFLNPATRHQSAAQRGREPFVELPWDEALDLVAGELQRVRDAHGNGAIFGGSYGWSSAGRFHHAQSQLHRFLNSFGGYVYSKDTYSLGAGRVLMPHIVDATDNLLQQHTSWDVLERRCELFVSFGGLPTRNTQVSPGGASQHGVGPALRRMAAAGQTRFVNISPAREDMADVPDAQWLAVRPGTDVALMLGLAHVLLAENLHDRAFLASHTTGFEQVSDYILGHADGQPKTPRWAAERCGIAADEIISLARRMAGQRTLVNIVYSLQRARHGEQTFWMAVTLAALLGQIGLPGGGFGLGYGCMNYIGSGRSSFSGARLPQGHNAVAEFIPVARIADMLLQPGAPFEYDGGRHRYPHVRLVYWAGGNVFHHHQDLNRTIAAWQRPETIITHEQYWTAQARHSDIVLPATTALERNDIGSASSERFMVAMQAAIAPVGEARDDYAIFAALARRLDFEQTYTEGRDTDQWLRHLYESARPRAEAQGIALPAFDDFWQAGHFDVPAPARPVVLLERFRADPVAHPLPTPSGRIELYSEVIASFGYDDCPGHATWFEPQRDNDSPIHLLSVQPTTRLHSQYDHGSVSRASKIAGREPITLNAGDAAARGIADGDVVRVFNRRGAFLAGARLTDGILSGVAQIATGAWYDPADAQAPHSLDKHGNANVVTPDIGSSRLAQGCAAQTTRVQIERWEADLPEITAFDPPVFAPV
ncbi:molybdopterin guanine dinucleotide-containing S/N-oxide reductase [Acidovorax sp. CCYZU-2555]|uniref:molybdopterin guanine dinucleotide-containing S/N-oxide reductase n=1 Tax=Acidovorax sp. CCYZU-2555 TaxID=2835042 RepID=UPI001BD13CA6|nr:molybdopterin guanine dinucleotide-containing S/N-oxide reductase [Acidovorax sp. CCYZU-2555]MBS7781097.1 molybdopterin guanine dinucleotide-containing S/N-oxide reductase [Acidovorax sp. CCYZU-2555]